MRQREAVPRGVLRQELQVRRVVGRTFADFHRRDDVRPDAADGMQLIQSCCCFMLPSLWSSQRVNRDTPNPVLSKAKCSSRDARGSAEIVTNC
jgi:hypothetical protein